MERIICLAIGYLFGMFQTSYIIGKIHHMDIRQYGSGNAGTTNALRTLGKKAGAMTLIGDMLKCVIAILIVDAVFKNRYQEILPLLGMYTAAGCVLGHNFPFYLKFKGGKGIAVLAGLVVSTGFLLVPVPLAAFLIAVIFTRYVSLGSLLAATMFFLEIVLFGVQGNLDLGAKYLPELYLLAGVIMALAWIRHRENIKRLLAGEENRFGSKKK